MEKIATTNLFGKVMDEQWRGVRIREITYPQDVRTKRLIK